MKFGDRMKKYKYIILDFGNVLAYPVSGHWFITNKFMEFIDVNVMDYEKINKAVSKFSDILSWKVVTLEEEENLFYNFYKNLFNELNYNVDDDVINEIVKNFTYDSKKCNLYDGVVNELDRLSKKYKLLLLSDNWPCGIEIMKDNDIDKYFDKMYISSVYGYTKSEGVFFDYPIEEYDIKPGEALFIDDNEKLLDVAVSKGLDVKLMCRDDIVNSKYEVINNLLEI